MPTPSPTQHIGLLGGSFDPVHLGHVLAARSVQQQLGLDKVVFLPAAQSPFKPPPRVSDRHRLKMLALAIDRYPEFTLDDREFARPGASYTVHTLRALRAEQPETHYYLIVGMDAWADFEQWHAWQEIMQLAHLIVVTRPDYPGSLLSAGWRKKQCLSVSCIRHEKAGKIMFLQMPAVPAASSQIRERLKQGLPVDEDLPASVAAYTRAHNLYR